MFKHFILQSACVISGATLSFSLLETHPASAATFDFSYKFLSGETISGRLDGDLQNDGDTVTNLRNLVASYSGKPGDIFTFFAPFGTSRISFSGLYNDFFGFVNNPSTPTEEINFGFSLDYQPDTVNSATVGNFRTSQDSIWFPFGSDQREAEIFSTERWFLSEAKSVTEPSTIVALSLLGLSLMAKKKLSRAA